MGWRLEAFKAAISGRPDRMQQFFTSRMTSPPDRNTQEFLATYARSPRLSPVTKIATDLSNVPGKLETDVSYIEGQDNGERLATININHLNAVAIIYFKSNNILGIH